MNYLIIIFIIIVIFLYLNYNSKPKLVLYYTNWCKYSQEFLPTWSKLKNDLKINFEEYDCEKSNCKNINGFPTLILNNTIQYPNDKPKNYDEIVKFVKSYSN